MNLQYSGFEFHYTYLITCAFLVWLIIPGIGLLYSGLARRKSSLALLFQSLMVCGVYVVPDELEYKEYVLTFIELASNGCSGATV